MRPPFLEFFAGSGLVTEGARDFFDCAWANDVSPKKAEVYRANHGPEEFHLGPIELVSGHSLPEAVMSWASFPCQDLSLAGKMGGIDAARSGLVWEWLRVMDEMKTRPPVVVAENVAGLLSNNGGKDYRLLHQALSTRGYRVGPIVLDAQHWVPQSRPRVFVVGVNRAVETDEFESWTPNWAHTSALLRAVKGLKDYVFWRLPEPPIRKLCLSDIVEFSVPCDDPATASHNIALIPEDHWTRLQTEARKGLRVAPGYKRTRKGSQCLELRFDGVAGCLRTPEGGSSRQLLVFPNQLDVRTRLITTREAARLMGAPERYKLPDGYNDAYKAMGDAVAVPVVQYICEHLLSKLAHRAALVESAK